MLQEAAAELLPGHRVRWCGCVPVGELVKVVYHPEHASASYGGLAVCGSPWSCPLCGAKIAARRARELADGVEEWERRGGAVLMITFTLRHQRGQPLKLLLTALNKAYQELHRGSRWVKFKARYGLIGTVTGREVTSGRNGWHPHLHAIFFIKGRMKSDEKTVMEGWLYHRWVTELKKLGLDATREYGVHIVEANKSVSDYVLKTAKTWSLSQEAVNALAKEGRRGNKTPQQLLVLYTQGNKRAGELFTEYANATKGLSPLVWSKGLKALLLGEDSEKTDGEIAEEQSSEGEEIIVLTTEQWSKIVRYRLRGDLLAEICECKYDNAVSWLTGCGIELAPWQLSYTLKD